MATSTTRRAAETDIKELEILLNKLGYDISSDSLTLQLREYNESRSIVLVAECKEDRIIGLAAGHAIPLLHQPGFLGRITALVVAENERGSGVGRKLVGALENWFGENQCLRYEVTSGEHRAMAHKFYEKLGYFPDERRFIKLP